MEGGWTSGPSQVPDSYSKEGLNAEHGIKPHLLSKAAKTFSGLSHPKEAVENDGVRQIWSPVVSPSPVTWPSAVSTPYKVPSSAPFLECVPITGLQQLSTHSQY